MIVREIECKSVLTKSGIEGVDYALNPYVGCAHGCVYCYASFMKRFTGHTEEWGAFADVKVNAAEVLARQMRRAKRGNIVSGTVTDPYKPLEERYEITRACLEVLTDYDFPISILTKSNLVLRDLDLLRRLKDVEVGFTITALDDKVQQVFEPRSPPASARLAALTELAEAGIKTWAFCGPLLPFLSDGEDQLDALFGDLARGGVSYIIVDSMKLSGAIWGEGQESAGKPLPRPGGGIPPYRHRPQALSRGADVQSTKARREAWLGLQGITMTMVEEKHLAGCCGLYCGLCPRFQSKAASRCLSCHLGEQHSYCSVYRCCVAKRELFTCADCDEYPCERLLRVLGVEEGLDSFISHKPALPNLDRIREVGLETYLEEQRERRLLVEQLLADYNEGRSMTFYCAACALMPPGPLRQAIGETERVLADKQMDGSNLKAKAKAMRAALQDLASQAGIDLQLRKKR